jgi:hypothetical protein
VANVRNMKRFRELAAELRELCALHGVVLVAGESEEILATKVDDIARQLGVTERTAMERYVTDDVVRAMAQGIGIAGATYQEAVDTAEPVTLSIADAGRVIAAVGMTMKLATDALSQPPGAAEALGVATDSADAVVGIGVAIRNTHPGAAVQVGGPTLVYARKVLQRTIELIRDEHWACPCRSRHVPNETCELQRNLAADLNLLGGWTTGPQEPPAEYR